MTPQGAVVLTSMLLLAAALGAVVTINLRRRFDINAILGISFTIVATVAVTNLLLVADRVKSNTARIDGQMQCINQAIEAIEARAQALTETYLASAERDAGLASVVIELRNGQAPNPVLLDQVSGSLEKSSAAKRGLGEVYAANPLPNC